MKKSVLISFFLSLLVFNVFAGVVVVEGKYQSKNLYVQNGSVNNGVGFCAYEVLINGQVTTDEVNANTFEIDFSQFQIKPGTEVLVEIKHKEGCTPKVLNPDALKAKATFEIMDMSIDKSGVLKWSTKNEQGSLPFIIEQYRWNIWIPVGEVQGAGEPSKQQYSFQLTPHSGENKFRIKQTGFGGSTKTSESESYNSTSAAPTFEVNKKTNMIEFSAETMYRVFDIYGNVIKKGFGNNCDISNLKKGSYYLCYDNVQTDFKK